MSPSWGFKIFLSYLEETLHVCVCVCVHVWDPIKYIEGTIGLGKPDISEKIVFFTRSRSAILTYLT